MEQLNSKSFNNFIVGIILFSLAFGGMVFGGDPFFSIDDPIEWEDALAKGSVKPIEEDQWNKYMFQWKNYLTEGKPYPENQFLSPELYVYGGSGEDNDVGGLVMTWGKDASILPEGSFSSAWYYDYSIDPDLSNCTITITVVAPQFSNTTGSQINAVSLGMRDVTGAVRGWQWSCGPVGSGAAIQWFVPTTITVNTALVGVGAASPTATGYMNNPGFNLTTVMALIVDENAQWNWQPQQTPPPPPGTTLIKPWNLWQNLSVSKNSTNPINVGINIDIHQDIMGAIANDFHIEGRIESGLPDGTWSAPPVLLEHIDGEPPIIFPNFVYSITPDMSNPSGNWYIFKADWSGIDIPYCQVIHLGLLFDVTCHNIIIDLKGWWTRDGMQIRDGLNSGFVPMLGFDVQDNIQGQPDLTNGISEPKVIHMYNMSREFGEPTGPPPMIPIEIIQMDLVSFPGPVMPIPFSELRERGLQETLPWVPVGNEREPIMPHNPLFVPPDSFFDVFFDIELELPPDALRPHGPVELQPGGFLLMRQLVQFINNSGEPEMRWLFEIHEAHDGAESDLGDAPDSTNTFGTAMTAYPAGGPAGVKANYPTVYNAGSPPFGPIHRSPTTVAHLGRSVTGEFEADTGPDVDPTNNIIPPTDKPDFDLADDGVLGLPFTLTSCQLMKFNYLVNVISPNNVLYANVWFDWNRDGDWDDRFNCSSISTMAVGAPEWAVQNQQLFGLPIGLNTVTSLPFRPYLGADAAGNEIPEDHPIWMRITLSEQKWQPGISAGLIGEGGKGPQNGYKIGETEDYYFVPKKTCRKDPDLDCSGFVDINDFAILARKWLQPIP